MEGGGFAPRRKEQEHSLQKQAEELRFAPQLGFFHSCILLGVFVNVFAHRSFQVCDRWVLNLLPSPDIWWLLLLS